ncbi:hypothetical protein ABTM86_19400, partial [Acinetobacter baumannii]
QINGLHAEKGMVTFDMTDASMRDFYFWGGASPRIILANETVTGTANRTVILENGLFIQNVNGYAASYDPYDIQVGSTYSLVLNDVYKAA